jgi:hypothetical protein
MVQQDSLVSAPEAHHDTEAQGRHYAGHMMPEKCEGYATPSAAPAAQFCVAIFISDALRYALPQCAIGHNLCFDTTAARMDIGRRCRLHIALLRWWQTAPAANDARQVRAMLMLSGCPHCGSLATPEVVLTTCPRCRHVCTPAERHTLLKRWDIRQQTADVQRAFVAGCSMVMLSLPLLCVWMITGEGGFADLGGWLLSSGFCLCVAILLFGEHYLYRTWTTYVSPEESGLWTGSRTLSAVTGRR